MPSAYAPYYRTDIKLFSICSTGYHVVGQSLVVSWLPCNSERSVSALKSDEHTLSTVQYLPLLELEGRLKALNGCSTYVAACTTCYKLLTVHTSGHASRVWARGWLSKSLDLDWFDMYSDYRRCSSSHLRSQVVFTDQKVEVHASQRFVHLLFIDGFRQNIG